MDVLSLLADAGVAAGSAVGAALLVLRSRSPAPSVQPAPTCEPIAEVNDRVRVLEAEVATQAGKVAALEAWRSDVITATQAAIARGGE